MGVESSEISAPWKVPVDACGANGKIARDIPTTMLSRTSVDTSESPPSTSESPFLNHLFGDSARLASRGPLWTLTSGAALPANLSLTGVMLEVPRYPAIKAKCLDFIFAEAIKYVIGWGLPLQTARPGKSIQEPTVGSLNSLNT